jgi:hypothetical protein
MDVSIKYKLMVVKTVSTKVKDIFLDGCKDDALVALFDHNVSTDGLWKALLCCCGWERSGGMVFGTADKIMESCQ